MARQASMSTIGQAAPGIGALLNHAMAHSVDGRAGGSSLERAAADKSNDLHVQRFRTNSAHRRYWTMPTYMIRAFSYASRTSRLTVAFVNGRIAVYEAVPPEVADDFLHAESKDAFFISRIHDHYRVREVTRRAA